MSDPAEMDFPFEAVAQFDTWKEAKSAGIPDENLWSVTEGEDDDDAGTGCETYGPPHHYANLLHVVQTAEAHDGETYHEVTFDRGR